MQNAAKSGDKDAAPCGGGGGRTAGTQYMSVYLQCPNNICYHVQCRYSVDWCLLKCTIMDCTVVFLSFDRIPLPVSKCTQE